MGGHPVLEDGPAIVRSDRDHLGGELLLDGFDVAEELLADHDRRGSAVFDDMTDLRCRQPPVDRHADRSELGQTEDDVEELEPVLLHERHPVPEPDARLRERLRHAAGSRVEFTECDGAVPADQGGCVGTIPAVRTDNIGDPSDHRSLGCIR